MPKAYSGSPYARDEQRAGNRPREPERFYSHQHATFFEQAHSPEAPSPEPSNLLETWLQRLEDLGREHQLAIASMRRELRGCTPSPDQQPSWHGRPVRREALSPPRHRHDTINLWEDNREMLIEGLEGAEADLRIAGDRLCRPFALGRDDSLSSIAEGPSARKQAVASDGYSGAHSKLSSGDDCCAYNNTSVTLPFGKTRTSFIGVEKPAPQKAFVVNLRRLMFSLEVLAILHEFVKSTAIAALTIVAAGTRAQLRNTMMFLLGVCFLYIEHEKKNDYLDIQDFKSLVNHYPGEPTTDNPNQVLKAMETRTAKSGLLLKLLLHVVVLGMLFFSWYNTTAWYDVQCSDEDCDNLNMERYVVHDKDDLDFASMQVVVLSLMYIFFCTFNAIHFYEMGWCMPRTSAGHVWDLRADGKPQRFKLFGLPSMWFTTKEAKDDLRKWVDALRPNRTVYQIFPEELGLLAVDGDEQMRNLVVSSLKDSKFYDAQRDKLEDDQTLDIELCYFTQDYHSPENVYPGTFLSPSAPAVDQTPLRPRVKSR